MQSWLADRLSEKLGRTVGRSEVNRWVHGIHEPADDTKAAIAEVLGRQIEDLWPASSARPAADEEREAA